MLPSTSNAAPHFSSCKIRRIEAPWIVIWSGASSVTRLNVAKDLLCQRPRPSSRHRPFSYTYTVIVLKISATCYWLRSRPLLSPLATCCTLCGRAAGSSHSIQPAFVSALLPSSLPLLPVPIRRNEVFLVTSISGSPAPEGSFCCVVPITGVRWAVRCPAEGWWFSAG